MKKGNIIFLNGTSSAGKTSLTRKLQETFAEPYFHISIDTYEGMVPEKHLDSDFWKYLGQSASAMHHSIKLFSDLGLNVIVDTVILDIPEEKEWLPECVSLLHEYPVVFVGVHCPIHELERREKERGDRDIGQAKWQLERIHGHKIYDIEINTFESSIEDCAFQIRDKVLNMKDNDAFKRLYKNSN
ncbi:AAA family ATPase [Bacillus sp. FJAT-49736]|uniref:chloramphenicol phosphotransferase CPT family protein n=1 Tax=Bacillus sp. FJAT-49736 TaxID=2833582 RepID=UPI001BC8ED5E|nr:AAA family ATPase [Bacillus sp. FJAT-49736]